MAVALALFMLPDERSSSKKNEFLNLDGSDDIDSSHELASEELESDKLYEEWLQEQKYEWHDYDIHEL